jgi:hypothetical protein
VIENVENLAVVELGVQIVLTMVAGRFLLAWDEGRMTAAQKERAWPPASRGMVVCSPLFFFPLWVVGLPLHFLRTRRNLRGAFEAFAATVVMFLLLLAIGLAFELVAGTA